MWFNVLNIILWQFLVLKLKDVNCQKSNGREPFLLLEDKSLLLQTSNNIE
jgi:hypothetical protein